MSVKLVPLTATDRAWLRGFAALLQGGEADFDPDERVAVPVELTAESLQLTEVARAIQSNDLD